MGEFRMPSLGADMEAGTIVEWRVKPGDVVHRGDIVAVIDTEKSTIDVEVFEDGVIEEILVPEGENVPVGTVLARVAPQTPSAAPVTSPVVRHLARDLGVDIAEVSGSGKGGTITRADVERAGAERVRSSPLARRRARQEGVDLAAVHGTGPEGAVTAADVKAATPADATPPERAPSDTDTRPALDRQAAMRGAIASLMARSKREIPHYYLSTMIDMSAALAWLGDANASRPVTERMLPAALLLKAAALAAREVPDVNGFWVDDAFRPSPSVHLGVAIALRQGGLLAPAIHDADRLALVELMQRLRDLVNRARTGSLRSSEMSDPTITVTNLGDQGVESVFGVIYPPQVALVGFGRIVERPWARQGMVGARPSVTATLSADHRASDGHRGAVFLSTIDRLLQEPDQL
jgi:pyruvate dehydrogenase E2 component (dihydrolipoamide acetyltransferase)